jgi:hypothetical protein
MGEFKGKRVWTRDEDEKLLSLMDDGVRRYQLSAHFHDRTDAAVKSRARLLRPPEIQQDYSGGSDALRDALNELIDRMPANDVAELLGKPHLVIPGTERVYRGHAAERLAA